MRRIDSVLADPRFGREAARAGVVPPYILRRPHAGFGPAAGAFVLPPGPLPISPVEEAVVLLQGRPSLLVRQNRFEIPTSGRWAEELSTQRELIEARLPSVGRIEVDDGAGFRHMGTGWVIAPRTIATNRHVAEHFAERQGGDGVRFLMNFMGAPYQARIDFREEYQVTDQFEVLVEQVVFLQDHDPRLPDVALLKLASHEGLPDPIPLRDGPLDGNASVVVIGYPARDDRYGLDAETAARAVYGSIYDVKRLSPGTIMGEQAANWFFAHDATTLGGNSGSVVLDIKTGHAVGMHFGGNFRDANYAVKASALMQCAQQYAAGVLVRKPLPPSAAPEAAAAAVEAVAEAVAPASYADRQGYQVDFLGDGLAVPLPEIRADQENQIVKFTDPATGKQAGELKYTHFSVVMNAARRMCFYSAVNIFGKQSVSLPGKRPSWRADPRIDARLQVVRECYGRVQDGKFDRGHMTRREDPNWGPDASKANEDTFHATNAVPQIHPFNAGIWNNLEDYALEHARQDKMQICVFTGPIFADDDPEFFGVKVPVRFWKVIAFVHDNTGKLCATGYTMSQRDFLPGAEFVYGQFQTYQNSLAELESLTGLSFGPLKALDPMQVVEEAPPMALRGLDEIRFA